MGCLQLLGDAATLLDECGRTQRLGQRTRNIGPMLCCCGTALTRKKVRFMVRSILSAVLMAAIAPPALTAVDPPALGRTATPEDIRRVDIDVMPDGRGLPRGEGRVSAGAAIYADRCEACHGAGGSGGPNGSLAGAPLYTPRELAADRSLEKTVGNYWPYATTLFDYIRRAMPFDRPGSLSDAEVYDLTAYILHLNGLVDASQTVDRESLPQIEMPAKRYFDAAAVRRDAR
jgi:cytochrome c